MTNQFGTHREFREAVHDRLKNEQYLEAATVILENEQAVSQYWLDWAFEIKAGIKQPPPKRSIETTPPQECLHLYGEPITTGKRARKRPVGADL